MTWMKIITTITSKGANEEATGSTVSEIENARRFQRWWRDELELFAQSWWGQRPFVEDHQSDAWKRTQNSKSQWKLPESISSCRSTNASIATTTSTNIIGLRLEHIRSSSHTSDYSASLIYHRRGQPFTHTFVQSVHWNIETTAHAWGEKTRFVGNEYFCFAMIFAGWIEKSYLTPDDDRSLTDPYTRISLGLTQCLRDYEGEINHAKRRIQDVSISKKSCISYRSMFCLAQRTTGAHLEWKQTCSFSINRSLWTEVIDLLIDVSANFCSSTITLRQTYEKRLTKQREESLKIGHSLDNYKVEILTLRWERRSVGHCQDGFVFREAYEKKLRVKDELITELNDRLNKNETEQAARQHALHLKVIELRGFLRIRRIQWAVAHLDRTFPAELRYVTISKQTDRTEQSNQNERKPRSSATDLQSSSKDLRLLFHRTIARLDTNSTIATIGHFQSQRMYGALAETRGDLAENRRMRAFWLGNSALVLSGCPWEQLFRCKSLRPSLLLTESTFPLVNPGWNVHDGFVESVAFRELQKATRADQRRTEQCASVRSRTSSRSHSSLDQP